MDANTLNNLTGSQRDEIKQQVVQQMAIQQTQEMLVKLNDTCFAKCITKPGSALSGSEQKCLGMCMDRFMETFKLVTDTYTNVLQRQAGNM